MGAGQQSQSQNINISKLNLRHCSVHHMGLRACALTTIYVACLGQRMLHQKQAKHLRSSPRQLGGLAKHATRYSWKCPSQHGS